MFRNLISSQLKSFFVNSTRKFQSSASTIFALSTNIKSSGSAIAIIRVSGDRTLTVINRLTNLKQLKPRQALLTEYFDPNSNELIDNGITLWFPKPNSYTGDDLCEFHIHGSWAIINKMLSIIGQMHGCRHAEHGEFTRRALLNGKIHLIQAESIRDLIEARTDNQRRRALNGLSGRLNQKFNDWRQHLIRILAHLEAYIDFGEEELIHDETLMEIIEEISKLRNEIDTYIQKSKIKSDLIKDGLNVAIIGNANVGKSSLINKLSEKDVSIISPISGTTRDIVETWLDIDGNCICIADTAGIKDVDSSSSSSSSTIIDPIEKQGIEKAIKRANDCHLIIMVIDAQDVIDNGALMINENLRRIIENKSNDVLFVCNKIDLLQNDDDQRMKLKQILSSYLKQEPLLISCTSNEGFDEFFNKFRQQINDLININDTNSDEQDFTFNNDRHLIHLIQITKELTVALENIHNDLAVASFHCHQASYHIGCLIGEITNDDVLDVLFKDFCIGK